MISNPIRNKFSAIFLSAVIAASAAAATLPETQNALLPEEEATVSEPVEEDTTE